MRGEASRMGREISTPIPEILKLSAGEEGGDAVQGLFRRGLPEVGFQARWSLGGETSTHSKSIRPAMACANRFRLAGERGASEATTPAVCSSLKWITS